MSQIFWLGTATAIAEIDVFTVASATAADVDLLTVKDEYGATLTTVSYTVPGSPSNSAVATAIAAAWNANTIAAAIATASPSSALVLLTAVNAGVPQYVTSGVTGTGTLAKSSAGSNGAVANSGPSDLNTLANYSTGAKPAGGDSFTVNAQAAAPILYGLTQTGVTLANLFIDLNCAQLIGQQKIPWQLNASNVVIGRSQSGNASGPRRINLDLSTVQTSVSVLAGNSSSADAGQETIRLKGTNASNTIAVSGGLVGVSTSLLADTSNFPTATADGGTLNFGVGCSTFTLVNNGATVNINGATTSVTTLRSGNTTFYGTAVATLIVAAGGTTYPASRPSGGAAVTTLTLAGGIVDFTEDGRNVTVSTLNLGNGTIKQVAPAQVTYSAIAGLFSGTEFTSATLQLQ